MALFCHRNIITHRPDMDDLRGLLRHCLRICGLLQDAKDEAAQKFDDWTDEHASDGSWPQWFVDSAVERMVGEIRDYGCGDMELVVDVFARNTGFTASDAEADAVYKEFLAGKKAT